MKSHEPFILRRHTFTDWILDFNVLTCNIEQKDNSSYDVRLIVCAAPTNQKPNLSSVLFISLVREQTNNR